VSECIVRLKDPICVYKEKGKSVTFENPALLAFDRGKVDDCLISDHRERCDYFLRLDDRIWLIELKGRDVGKAISQIASTIEHLGAEIGERLCIPVIVTSGSPAIAGKQKQLLAFKRFGRKISTKIVLQTRHAKISF
jgi:hypothetical protein